MSDENNMFYANTNLRWCVRAWKDGDMQDLALFLYRKAIAQLTLADLSHDTILETLKAHLTREVAEDLDEMNQRITRCPVAYAAWQNKIQSLLLC